MGTRETQKHQQWHHFKELPEKKEDYDLVLKLKY